LHVWRKGDLFDGQAILTSNKFGDVCKKKIAASHWFNFGFCQLKVKGEMILELKY